MDNNCSDSDLEFELYSQTHYGYDDTIEEDFSNLQQDSDAAVVDGEPCLKQNNSCCWLDIIDSLKEDTDDRLETCSVASSLGSIEEWELLQGQSANLKDCPGITLHITDNSASWDVAEDIRAKQMQSNSRYYALSDTRCRKCNQLGHLAMTCPKLKNLPKCYVCSKVGHIARNCRQFKDDYFFNMNIVCRKCGQNGHKAVECPGTSDKNCAMVQPHTTHNDMCQLKSQKKRYCDKCERKVGFGHKCTTHSKRDVSACSYRTSPYESRVHTKKESKRKNKMKVGKSVNKHFKNVHKITT